MTYNYLKFDPRSKLCVVFFASISLMFPLSFTLECVMIGIMFSCLVASGSFKKGLLFVGVFVGLWVADQFLFYYVPSFIGALLDFLAVGNRRLLPTVMAVTFALDKTKISEWLAALQRLHLPAKVLVPLAILFRFFPMAIKEMLYVRRAMKFRGIAVSFFSLFRHPLQTMEYLFVPLLLSAEETSLNLSATALVRGLGNPLQHTSYYTLRLNWYDYTLMVFVVLCLVIRMWVK